MRCERPLRSPLRSTLKNEDAPHSTLADGGKKTPTHTAMRKSHTSHTSLATSTQPMRPVCVQDVSAGYTGYISQRLQWQSAGEGASARRTRPLERVRRRRGEAVEGVEGLGRGAAGHAVGLLLLVGRVLRVELRTPALALLVDDVSLLRPARACHVSGLFFFDSVREVSVLL